jgi:uncharacterized protein
VKTWPEISRRQFAKGGAALASMTIARGPLNALAAASAPLDEFGYGDVTMAPGIAEDQLNQTHAILMALDEDSLLRPFRQTAGKPAPGADLGGWYPYVADYDYKRGGPGFAPGCTYGQWISALSRSYAISKSPAVKEKVLRLNQSFAQAISGAYFDQTRFPAYSYDKAVCGLIDAHQFVTDTDAFAILDRTTDIALPHLPPRAVTRELVWRPGKDVSYTWDESYTLPENLFLAYRRGAGGRYRELAQRYLEDETYFDLLAAGQDPMSGRHAYSYVNALSSAMQAYLTTGSDKHLQAAKHGFDLLVAQSYATGGWGPDEQLRDPAGDALFTSLTKTHSSFETPCGAYAHVKLTRYLLRVTRDSRYGDSMERVIYNTVFGARPLQEDGHAFYYADYNVKGKRVYASNLWPCCSGTLPQIAADYRIATYFHDDRSVYVNLYLPSTLHWTTQGQAVSITQQGAYPLEGLVRIKLAMARDAGFALHLRIPGWAEGAAVAINGKQPAGNVVAGTFLRLDRSWKNGDEIALTLPMVPRLEAINSHHPDTVALLAGPLVLFPLGEQTPEMTRTRLLSARAVSPSRWAVAASGSEVIFAPYIAVGDDPYSTYVKLSTV